MKNGCTEKLTCLEELSVHRINKFGSGRLALLFQAQPCVQQEKVLKEESATS